MRWLMQIDCSDYNLHIHASVIRRSVRFISMESDSLPLIPPKISRECGKEAIIATSKMLKVFFFYCQAYHMLLLLPHMQVQEEIRTLLRCGGS